MHRRALPIAIVVLLAVPFIPSASARDWPPCVTGLTATSDEVGVITVTWDAVADATGYSIDRRLEDGSLQEGFATVGADETSFVDVATVDGGLGSGSTFGYRVTALGLPGSDTASCLWTAAVAGVPPGEPACPTLRGAIDFSGEANLTWDAVEGATSYRVWKAIEDGDLVLYESMEARHRGLGDANVVPGTRYFYAVTVMVDDAESEDCPFIILDVPSDGHDHTTCGPLSAEAIATGGVRLTWPAHAFAASWEIVRSSPGDSQQFEADFDDTGFVDTTTRTGAAYNYTLRVELVDEREFVCGSAVVTAVPEFPTLVVGALAVVGAVLGYVAMRRR